ncbi:MAG TPA: TrmH family RNA methyltransferase [Candidatus Saccharimonadales bacterium]
MPKITLVLHNIRSTHNVGSIFRTAEGFGVEKIVCSGYTPYPKIESDSRLPHISEKLASQIHKTALGAEEMVPFEYYEDIDQWFAQNKLPIVALEQSSDSKNIDEYTPSEDFALLLGEEVHGIEEQYLAKAQTTLEIPMKGKKESFNVSVAAAIALYELSRSI